MKVLLIVIDGLSYHLFERFRHELSTLNFLAENGVFGKLESVFPALTPVALASLFTGVNPQRHGILGPKISSKGRKISNPLSAFDSRALLMDPIWVSLAKKGYRTLITSAPQALPDKWKISNLILFDPYKAKIKHCSKGIIIKEGKSNVLGKEWEVKRIDGKFLVRVPTTVGYNELELHINEWSKPIEFTAICKEDKEINGVTILHAREDSIYLVPPAFHISSWSNSEELMEKVWKDVVLNVGMVLDGDYKSLNSGLITFDEYIKTVEYAFNFFTAYSVYLLKSLDWDFAVTYLPIIDNLQHVIYGIDDGKALDILVLGYKMADTFVREQLDFADYVIVCSDHGISKIKKRVYINKVLERLNVLKINENGIDWSHTKAVYLGGGHIRINLKGREEKGIVRREEYPKLINYIARNLEKMEDKDTGKRIFSSIIVKELPSNNREGDIIVNVSDFYSISSDIREHEEIEDVIPYKTVTGDHGYYRKEDLYGVLILYGKDLKSRKRISMKIVDIAPTVLKMFKMPLDSRFNGKPIGDV